MSFQPAWHSLSDYQKRIAPEVINEVTEVLLAPDPAPEELSQVEICVILGSKNCGYKAERAAELFGANRDVIFVACGANLALNGKPEATVIRDTLIENGVLEDRIFIEEHSKNTGGNLYHAEQLITGKISDPRTRNLAVLSSWFHRLHVIANLPDSLQHARFINAFGPSTGPDTWHTNQMGRAIILHELLRPGLRVTPVPA